MGWLGKLFGTDEALKTGCNVVSGIMTGIDSAFFTDQEKSQNNIKVLLSLQDQFTPRAISRRIISFMFCGVFCIAFLISIIFACLDKIEVVTNIVNLVKAFDLGFVILTIVIFYFGNYALDKLQNKKD